MKTGAGIIFLLLLLMPMVTLAQENSVDPDLATSVEERRILVSIEDQYAKLDEREAEINSRELQLKTLAAEVDKKLAAMTKLRDELNKLLDQKENVEGERVGELSLIYEKMNPQKAAQLIKDLDQELAVQLLLGIKKKTAGKILDSLDAKTATTLSKAFTEIPIP